MKAFLMYKDKDFETQWKLPWNEQTLTQDLELNTLFSAMAMEDKFLYEVVQKAVLSSLTDMDTIIYRQNILKDCLKNSSIVRDIYDIAVEAITKEKKNYLSIFSKYPDGILHRAVEVLQMFIEMLKKLKYIADEHRDKFESDGFKAFFSMIKRELDEDYFAIMQNHLMALKFQGGVLISAELGKGNKGINYVLRKSAEKKQSLINRIFGKKPPAYSFYVADRDEAGAKALSELRDRGVNLVANALAQSTDHILSFFKMLRTELAFYIGCLNLHGELTSIGEPMCFPIPAASGERKYSFKELYDVCLALTLKQRIVGNDINADNKELFVITGANQGGKSTFLRSVGLSQIMMQCGMFAAAQSFSSNICNGLFTHYKREEDFTMKSGKLDEELSRMSDIVDNITTDSMILFNESFAATNEREGSEIGRQITLALLEKHIKVFSVTHLYEFANGFYKKNMENAVFLRAERQSNGERTFKIIEGPPLQTSFGEDLYSKVFSKPAHDAVCQQ